MTYSEPFDCPVVVIPARLDAIPVRSGSAASSVSEYKAQIRTVIDHLATVVEQRGTKT